MFVFNKPVTTCSSIVDALTKVLIKEPPKGKTVFPLSWLPAEIFLIEASLVEEASKHTGRGIHEIYKAAYVQLSSFKDIQDGFSSDMLVRSRAARTKEARIKILEEVEQIAKRDGEFHVLIGLEAGIRSRQFDDRLEERMQRASTLQSDEMEVLNA